MLIALPNPDRTFTCTLFAPYETYDRLEKAEDDEVLEFFRREFPDAVARIPDVVHQYRAHPTGALATIRVNPWNIGSRLVLIGDAAHAIVPFYGQGMNCGFEDALVLNEAFDACGGDLEKAIPEYSRVRRPQANAIADLSLHNYIEMRSKTASPLFRLRKRVEAVLHYIFPSWWIPLYSMVAFTRIPYDEALRRAERQDRIITIGTRTVFAAAIVGIAALLATKYGKEFRSVLGLRK